jgi:two-component system LytT family response regulator
MDVTQNVPVPNTGESALHASPVVASTAESVQAFSRAPALVPLRVLIADDQQLSREVLRRMLKDEPEVSIVAVAASGEEAVEAIRRERPNLVLLDVEMPDLDGFGVVRQIAMPEMPVVVFVTANESFAIRAFDIQATDYLIKPCTRDRLRVALSRARELLKLRQNQDLEHRLRQALSSAPLEKPTAPYLAVNADNRILFVKTTDIAWIEYRDHRVTVHFRQQAYTLADSMAALWQKLPAEEFVQLNANTVVNLGQIQELQSNFGQSVLAMRDGSHLVLDDASLARLRQYC